MFDVALLRKAVEWVQEQDRLGRESREREWDQGTWARGVAGYVADGVKVLGVRYLPVDVSCGTACCVAGKICLVSGDRFVTSKKGGMRPGQLVHVEQVVGPDGWVWTIMERARALLGITELEAAKLFASNNDAANVLRLARSIAAAHGEELGL